MISHGLEPDQRKVFNPFSVLSTTSLGLLNRDKQLRKIEWYPQGTLVPLKYKSSYQREPNKTSIRSSKLSELKRGWPFKQNIKSLLLLISSISKKRAKSFRSSFEHICFLILSLYVGKNFAVKIDYLNCFWYIPL